ncbi:hypothetical protein L1987_01629 [Smallanthus sonchifolius]|uniref:Uncharacterized protein n=1 Tax=Smallanthus sonchifolius TaxID=185202 RepID=A0ACB9K5K5_9ASTR|nr:hypothetical protein L1987_01629 [Smallanthus sonchifolius]
MSHPNPVSPSPRLSNPPPPLHKQKSVSTDFCREEAWLRRKDNHHHHLHRRSKSLITTEDIDELKGCVDLGFHFASEPITKLSKTLPALDLYYATSSPTTPRPSSSSSTTTSSYGDSDSPPQPCSPATGAAATGLFNSGENPEMVKRILKQWAQVVACAARQPACHQADPKD